MALSDEPKVLLSYYCQQCRSLTQPFTSPGYCCPNCRTELWAVAMTRDPSEPFPRMAKLAKMGTLSE
jgi:hypothetical protein